MVSTKYFCTALYNCTYIPISYYHDQSLQLVLPDVSSYLSNSKASMLKLLLNKGKNVCYHVTEDFHYYGLVTDPASRKQIVIGPVISSQPTDSELRAILRRYDLPSSLFSDLKDYFLFIPLISFYQFTQLLALAYQHIFDEEFNMREILSIFSGESKKEIGLAYSAQRYELIEQQCYHNTYQYEKRYLEYIRRGDADSLILFFQNNYRLQEGKIASDSLRQAKNIAIASITIATRAAIEGGMDIEAAYQLSDIYIQESEKLHSTDEIHQLQYTMLIDFTRRVAQSKLPNTASSDIQKCIQYIKTHVNEPISVTDVANYIGKSRAYISHNFAREMGFQMNHFIMDCKLEEAKMLLTYTEKSISEISTYLCFSSQSYFQNVFKEKYGMTPNHYRKNPSLPAANESKKRRSTVLKDNEPV